MKKIKRKKEQKKLKFINVSRDFLCTICGKHDWCSYAINSDGDLIVICRRVQRGDGIENYDVNNVQYYTYYISKEGFNKLSIPDKCYIQDIDVYSGNENIKIAEPQILNKVYECLLCKLPLEQIHRTNLTERGLLDYQISILGCRTWPFYDRVILAEKMLEHFDEGTLLKVPGFFLKGDYLSVAGVKGLAIPIRNIDKQIVAIKIRSSSSHRYSYLSSRKYGGPSPGTPVHVPVFTCATTDTIRVTEGELKAGIATLKSGILTLGLPGVSLWSKSIPILKKLNPTNVIIAFDADARTNSVVAMALKEAFAGLGNEGFNMRVELW